MRQVNLLVHINGETVTNAQFFDISNKIVAAFKRRNTRVVGEFVCNKGIKIVHDPTRQMYGAYGSPSIWIIGLDQREWYGEKLRSLLYEIEAETKVYTYSATN